ncbi:MAG: hybrid sensor histidine kinase/response regulator, partial [Gammaproteobacteria bacterium]
EGSVARGAALMAVIGDAIELLPGMIGQLRGASGPQGEVLAVMGRAEALMRGDASDDALPTDPDGAPGGTEDDDQSVSDSGPWNPVSEPPRIADPILYDTFCQEANEHLIAVEAFGARCREQGPACRISEALVRAFHTLHGSADMAGVPEIAAVAEALEKLVQLPAADKSAHELALGDLLEESVALIRTMVQLLVLPGARLPDHHPLLDRIARTAGEHLARIGPRPGSGPAADPDPMPEAYPASQSGDDHVEPVGVTVVQLDRVPQHPDPVPESAVDELANELAEIFLEESEELLEAADETIQRWEQQPEDVRRVTELQRQLHTLKGGARMADIAPVADLSHAMESLLSTVVDGHVEVSQPLFQTLHLTLDRLHAMQEQLRAGGAPAPAPELVAELETARTGKPTAAPQDPDVSEVATTTPPGRAEIPDPEPLEIDDEEPPGGSVGVSTGPSLRMERRAGPRVQSESVRVRADLLDNLVNYAGEVSIYRSRMEQQTAAMRFNLVEFAQTVARLREQLRRMEIETEAQILYRHEAEVEARQDFDPLELDRYSHVQQLSRGLAESVNDLVSIQGLLDHLARESETLLLQQSRVNTDLQEGLMRTRMVPFAGLVPRLRRIVRQTCTTLSKRADLKVQGAEGEMDRTVLDRLVAPLEHMLRNAVSHGIELPAERRAAGKHETGTITVSLAREGSEVVIRVSDDGAGIDLGAIRSKAVERGMLTEDADVSDHDVMQFILESGFSTARKLTQISGRGVGMDVVNSEIKQLGGQLDINSRAGEGMAFTVRLPFTLAVSQALLVYVGDEIYAIPLSSVEGIVRMSYEEISARLGDAEPELEYAGQRYGLLHMGALLGISAPPAQTDKKIPVLLMRSAEHQTALLVDGLMGNREIVVKSVGPQISTVRGISGATILGDGRVVLIIDGNALVRLSAVLQSVPAPEPEQRHWRERAIVMVVDDSITVRKVTTRLLERNDMDVLTAKDGVDAVALLQEHIPDVMLLDIEMPRMDGFELATHMRNDERLKEVPIIMITSRTGEKHRDHAMKIGVNRYLGKPFQETELLENIHALLSERDGHDSR